MTATLAEVVRLLDRRYPPRTAESWDRVGLVAGDPAQPVRKVLFAVDPVATVVEEALDWGADLVVTHHPLLLRGVHSVAASEFKGALVHRLIRAGCALYTAHTNADAATDGVADRLADLLGLVGSRPLVPEEGDAAVGLGRVGELDPPLTLRALAERVAAVLPATAQGIRYAGPDEGPVRTVAVLGGSGDSLFDQVRASGADAYVTSDLRHHPASELRERAEFEGGTPYLIDTAHFASEWPWLPGAERALTDDLAAHGTTVETRVSTRRTDPWTGRVPSPSEGPTP